MAEVMGHEDKKLTKEVYTHKSEQAFMRVQNVIGKYQENANPLKKQNKESNMESNTESTLKTVEK
jgi:hypothetical protein